MKYYRIIVYKKQDETYYFKKLRSFCSNHIEGEENGYGHKIILVIDLVDLFSKRKNSIRNRALDRVIARLEKMKKR